MARLPELRLQAVEIDPEVVDAAYRWFKLPRDERLTVDADDGRRWLSRHEERWDAIVLDAFYADSIPFHLATSEFLELAASRLEPGGVIVTNMIGSVTGSQSRLFRSLVKTYRSVFPTVSCIRSSRPDSRGPDEPAEHHRRRGRGRGAVQGVPPRALGGHAGTIEGRAGPRPRDRRPLGALIPTRDVPLLTDDYAPTDARAA